MQHPVYCERCADEIGSQGDLVTVLKLPSVIAAYHVRCYGLEAKGLNAFGTPLNSVSLIWLMVVFGLLCLFLFVANSFNPAFLIIACIIPLLRLGSWLVVERHISHSSAT